MPTYDFKCKKCKKSFTVMVSIAAVGRVKCPKCKSRDIGQVYETITVITKKKT